MGARRGRPAAPVDLDDAERETLERWARRPKSSQALGLRCRIVLGAAAGRANNDIAAELGCHPATVSKWRKRFAQRRLDGLADDAAAGPAAQDHRRGDRGRARAHVGDDPAGRDALVDAVDGRSSRGVADGCVADMARVRAQAPPHRRVQGVPRPISSWTRSATNYRRAVPEPARRGGGAVRGRKDPDPGARPHRADPAAAARHVPSGAPTTTAATAPPTCSQPSRSPRARSSPP